VGNCFYLEKSSTFRIWLSTHTDVGDVRQIPYLAKHRGEPGLPEYLEDKANEPPFTTCSLRHYYELEAVQFAAVRERDEKIKSIVLVQATADGDAEMIVEEKPQAAIVASGAVPAAAAPTGLRRRVGGPRPVPVAVSAAAPATAPVQAPTVGEARSPLLSDIIRRPGAEEIPGTVSIAAPAVTVAAAAETVPIGAGNGGNPTTGGRLPAPIVSPSVGQRVRRVPRPPTT